MHQQSCPRKANFVDRNGILKVTSPIYKQNFKLKTGKCLDYKSMSVASYPVKIVDGSIGNRFTVVRNLKDELKTGTLKAMLKQLGIREDEI